MAVVIPTKPESSPAVITRKLGSARTICISFVKKLKTTEALATVSVEVSPVSGLGNGTAIVNAAIFEDTDGNRDPVAVGKGVLVRLTPTKRGTYYLKVTCTTSEAGESVSGTIKIEVT